MINDVNKPILTGSVSIWETGGGTDGIFRLIEFTNGFIVNYQESFDMNSGSTFTCSFTISAEQIKMGQTEPATLHNKWPLTS